MKNRFQIRGRKTDSVNAVNKDMAVGVEMQSTSQPMSVLDVRNTVDQHEQFLVEREKCNQHRLIVTITPFCTNVLFNPLTEIVKDEGSSNAEVRTDNKDENKEIANAYGKKKPTRAEMVQNTEYSRPEIGYVYHPGFDIFNNHILRNKSFKVVNPLNDRSDSKREIFNTIKDEMRRPDGELLPVEEIRIALKKTDPRQRHLYINDDIMSYLEAVDTNLTEENGWFGFINASNVDAWITSNNGKKTTLGIGKYDNSKLRCEFVDMYPDRTLFSFVPKYNQFRKRIENNWDILLTYPAKKTTNHDIVRNGLLIAEIKKINNYRGRDILMVRTYAKHNLKSNDELYFYYSDGSGIYNRMTASCSVFGVGNLDGKDEGYYFYITDLSLITEVLGIQMETESTESVNNDLKRYTFTLKRVHNGRESEYYIRMFKKLPNAIEGGNVNLDREHYKLAFANSIYNDSVAQTTFTDPIDVENLTDHLGRPVSEVYVTIIKRNRGYEEWYKNQEFGNDSVEFSHCFGPVTGGFKFDMDKDYSTDDWIKRRRKNDDISVINDQSGFNNGEEIISQVNEKDVTNNAESPIFYGDIVEFIPYEYREVILDVAYHRFNTWQRDNGELFGVKEWFTQEIVSDDFDLNKFNVTDTARGDLQRPEGYYYQPHYRIPIKSFGNIQQASHYEIRVKEAKPQSTMEGMMIRLTTRLPHHLAPNDTVYIVDPSATDRKDWMKVSVVEVIGTNAFLFRPFDHEKLSNWIRTCYIFNAENDGQKYKLYRQNTTIPNYALQVGSNRFLWRETLHIGNMDAIGLPEYPFANGYFYIHRPINFFLRRQDPHGYNRLYAKDQVPNDVFGNTLNLGNYEYKDENQMLC